MRYSDSDIRLVDVLADYLPLTGGSLTGDLAVDGDVTSEGDVTANRVIATDPFVRGAALNGEFGLSDEDEAWEAMDLMGVGWLMRYGVPQIVNGNAITDQTPTLLYTTAIPWPINAIKQYRVLGFEIGGVMSSQVAPGTLTFASKYSATTALTIVTPTLIASLTNVVWTYTEKWVTRTGGATGTALVIGELRINNPTLGVDQVVCGRAILSSVNLTAAADRTVLSTFSATGNALQANYMVPFI